MELKIDLKDRPSLFLAGYLSWARKTRAYGTSLPLISYRGHACENWPLLPTLCRQKNMDTVFLKDYESDIIREFRTRFDLKEWNDVEVLAFARHHGAPTRLLDWSRNPLIGLWFSVASKEHDASNGAVFQLDLMRPPPVISIAVIGNWMLDEFDNHGGEKLAFMFSSPPRVERTERQRSAFTITTFHDKHALQPLDQIGQPSAPVPIRKYGIPSELKAELRRLLSDLGLDAYSLYGDADSFGKALTTQFDFSDLRTTEKE